MITPHLSTSVVRLLVAGGLVAGTLATGVAAAEAAEPGPESVGAAGVGDRYFPKAGNGGYDVGHYDLRLRYDPRTDQLRGEARIDLTPDERLSRFNLDLRKPLRVREITVDGSEASWRQRKSGELQITPASALGSGVEVQVAVVYRGDPGNPVDQTGAPYGWWTTGDGAMVANEPEGASTWFPANDHPTDKATFDLRATVPEGTAAIGNGDFLGTSDAGEGWQTWRWRSRELMATYLATATVGDFDVLERDGPDGLPIVDAVDRDLGAGADEGLAATDRQLEFFSDTFGPYPFGSYGAIIDDDSVGYALETQTRPIYSGPPSEGLVAHEMAHQWYGNSVTLGRWQDIWLNEGFAVYATWLWSEHEGGASPAQRFAEIYQRSASDPFWSVPPGDPGIQQMFGGAVYSRGAMTLQALRETIGDDDFFRVLRRWASERADGDGTTPQLRRLAEKVSGEDLRDLFQEWLYEPSKPAGWDRAEPGDLPPVDGEDSHRR